MGDKFIHRKDAKDAKRIHMQLKIRCHPSEGWQTIPYFGLKWIAAIPEMMWVVFIGLSLRTLRLCGETFFLICHRIGEFNGRL
jgi:hypothetical protein